MTAKTTARSITSDKVTTTLNTGKSRILQTFIFVKSSVGPISVVGLSTPGSRVDYNIKCNTKKYGHHTHFRVKCNYHKTKGTEVEYEVLYTLYTI